MSRREMVCWSRGMTRRLTAGVVACDVMVAVRVEEEYLEGRIGEDPGFAGPIRAWPAFAAGAGWRIY